MVKRDRVRKSSGWTDGVANVETDCAADFMARRDAVRFDLKLDPRRPNDADRLAGTVSGVAGSLSILISMNSSSTSISFIRRGWSKSHSSQFEYRGCRLSGGLLWLEGVGGERRLDGDARPWSNEGIESLEVDLTDGGDSCSESWQGRSLSGGLSRMSRGE